MNNIIGLPAEGLSLYIKKQIEKEVVETAIEIESLAKISAPKITGNYADQIKREKNLIGAYASYSYWLEYGVKKDGTKFINQQPYATMRKAAKEVASKRGHKYD